MKILLISDNPLGSSGGAEANDIELKKLLKCDFCQTKDFVDGDYDLYILSNHYDISEKSIEFLLDKPKIHISHDYLFCHTRNPGNFYNGGVPHEFQRNREFLLSCEKIIVHSRLQQEIWLLNDFKTINFSGNLWKQEDFNYMNHLRVLEKNGRAFVLANENHIKGQRESEEFCWRFKIEFDLLPPMGYTELLEKMSEYSMFVFMPQSAETFSRTAAEAKMLNCAVATNNLLGFSYNDEYKLDGENLIEAMKAKKRELVDLITLR